MTYPQLFKIASGAAQVVGGVWLVAAWPATARPSRRIVGLFGLAFALNGIAYAIFNTALPGTRTAGTFALEGRGVFNWLSIAAMLAFVGGVLASTDRSTTVAAVLGVVLGGIELDGIIASGTASTIDWLAWSGQLIAVARAGVLGVLVVTCAMTRSAEARRFYAFISAALIIDSVGHLGAGIVPPRSSPPLELVGTAILVALWVRNALIRADERRLASAVVICAVAFFAAGTLTRLVVGSYRAVQASGFIGVGRLIASAIVVAAARGVGRVAPRRPPFQQDLSTVPFLSHSRSKTS